MGFKGCLNLCLSTMCEKRRLWTDHKLLSPHQHFSRTLWGSTTKCDHCIPLLAQVRGVFICALAHVRGAFLWLASLLALASFTTLDRWPFWVKCCGDWFIQTKIILGILVLFLLCCYDGGWCIWKFFGYCGDYTFGFPSVA